MPRLRRSDCSQPGLTRRRHGRAHQYRDAKGGPLTDPAELARIRELAIPPAWRDVWICPDPLGHLQATGLDAAGRKQYLYHPAWRAHRDREKFDRMLAFASRLPALRRRVACDLARGGLARERVLACAVRLLDLGFFRIGSEGYADENGTFGLATMRREHVTLGPGRAITFDYPAKGGKRRVQSVVDPDAFAIVGELARRRGRGELLAYRVGRRWVDVRSADVNDYVKEAAGGDFSAKDFRTWNATVLAAVALAVAGPAGRSPRARRRVVSHAIGEVARYLGNTPAVCRASYVDPRVIDRFDAGQTIEGVLERFGDEPYAAAGPAVDRAVLRLLGGRPGRGRAPRSAPARPRSRPGSGSGRGRSPSSGGGQGSGTRGGSGGSGSSGSGARGGSSGRVTARGA